GDDVSEVLPQQILGLLELTGEDQPRELLVLGNPVVLLWVALGHEVPQDIGHTQSREVSLSRPSPHDEKHFAEPFSSLGLEDPNPVEDIRLESVVPRMLVLPRQILDDLVIVGGQQIVPQEDQLQQGRLTGVEVRSEERRVGKECGFTSSRKRVKDKI